MKDTGLNSFAGLTKDSLKLHDPLWSNEFDVPSIFSFGWIQKKEKYRKIFYKI
jgi:hypothetical protein